MMTKKEALAEARRRFGPKGYVELRPKVVWREADRVAAREELKAHRVCKPVRPNWGDATDDEKRAFWKVNREWVARENELMSITWTHRCSVGEIMQLLGAFHVMGSGDSFEDAFAEVDQKAERHAVAR